MDIKVSVIVPIYNVEKYLKKCIESIINQTLKEIEIILVDDGSTDNSGKIADKYAKVDKRVKVIHKENGGQGSARNVGIENSVGDYLGFVDPDDWIDLNMYEELYSSAKKNNSDISVCSRNVYKDNMTIGSSKIVENDTVISIEKDKVDYIINHLFYPHTVSTCNKIYRSSLLKENKIRFKDVSEVGSEDALFNYCAILNSKKITTVDNVFYNCLEREGSTTRIYKEGAMKRTANLIKDIYEYSYKNNENDIVEVIAPIILLFFQQWNYDYIKTYNSGNIKDCIKNEHKLVNKEKWFKKAERGLIFKKSSYNLMKKMGYSKKGILFIRLYMMFSNLNFSGLASKIRVS